MRLANSSTGGAFALAGAVLFLTPKPQFAYVGPGAGLELTGHFVWLLVLVGLAAGAVVLWPVVRIVARLRRDWAEAKAEPSAVSSAEPVEDCDQLW